MMSRHYFGHRLDKGKADKERLVRTRQGKGDGELNQDGGSWQMKCRILGRF